MEGITTGAESRDLPLPRAVLVAASASVVLVHGLLWWLYYRPQVKGLWGDELLYLGSARRLLAGNPGWHPEALWPAMAPRFIAGVLAVTGPSLVWLQLVQTAMLAITAVVLADLVRRLTGSSSAAAVAGLLTVGYPPLAAFANYLWPEVLHLFLWVTVLWLLVARPTSWRWAALAGVALGLALLTKSVLGPFVPVLLATPMLVRGWRSTVAPMVILALVAAATVAPTVIGNSRRLGVAMIADSSAFNLWVGLNDRGRRNFEQEVAPRAYVEYIDSGDTLAERNAVLRSRIRTFLRERPLWEVLRAQAGRQYFRLFDKGSYLTDQLPGGAAARDRAGYRGDRPVLEAVVRGVAFAVYAAMLAAAPLGFALWRFRRPGWVRVLLLFVAYNLALFFWLHVKTRYRIQMLPVLFVGCGAAVAWLQLRLSGVPAPAVARWRWPVGLAAALTLLLLAFAGPWI